MASEIRNRFTDTEMQIARETDLPELLSHLGYQVKRVGRFHTTAEMDSLRIKDRRTWFRYSQNTGGDAITFLQQFCGKSFPEAVEYLLTFHGKARDAPIPQPKPISPKQEFSLPPRNADDRRVFAYLRKRGIAAQVIRQFLNAGLLYEDAVHHNCVFVGRDESGQAKYAGLRGTYDLDSPGFKGDATGSDKNTGFSLPHDPRSDLVLVFEAPIDLMSYLTLHRDTTNAVALCGLYRRVTWIQHGMKRIVWRCTSRVDYGKKYCTDAPTLDEGPLQEAILNAVNSVMTSHGSMVGTLMDSMVQEFTPTFGENMSLGNLDRAMERLGGQFNQLLSEAANSENLEDYTEQFRSISDAMAELKRRRAHIESFRQEHEQADDRAQTMMPVLEGLSSRLTEWNEEIMYQLLEKVTVLSRVRIRVTLRDGQEIEQAVNQPKRRVVV